VWWAVYLSREGRRRLAEALRLLSRQPCASRVSTYAVRLIRTGADTRGPSVGGGTRLRALRLAAVMRACREEYIHTYIILRYLQPCASLHPTARRPVTWEECAAPCSCPD